MGKGLSTSLGTSHIQKNQQFLHLSLLSSFTAKLFATKAPECNHPILVFCLCLGSKHYVHLIL